MNIKKVISFNLNAQFTKRMHFIADSAKFDVPKNKYFKKPTPYLEKLKY